MKQKKTKLSMYLLKEGSSPGDAILIAEKDAKPQKIVDVGTFYSTTSFSSKPKWLSFFGDEIEKDELFNASACAVLLVPIEIDNSKRYFAIPFGRGLSLLNRDCIEERFGLKTVLNEVKPDSIRRIAKTEIAGNSSKLNEQLPKKAEIQAFSFDIERDLLNGITATGEEGSLLSGTVNGGDSLSLSTSLLLKDLPGFLRGIYKRYI